MGKRGPPPKPKALKQQQGTYRKDRDQTPAVPPLAGEPPMPPDVQMDEAALRRWREIVPELLRIGTLSVVDGGTLEAYCLSYSFWSVLMRTAREKPIVKGKANSVAGEARMYRKEVILPLEVALGLNYAARARAPALAKSIEDDPAAAFFFGNGKCPLRPIDGGLTEPSTPQVSAIAGSGSAPTLGAKP